MHRVQALCRATWFCSANIYLDWMYESFILGCLLSVCQRGIDAWPLIAAVKVLALHSLCWEWCWQPSIFQKTKKPSVGRRLLISLESSLPLHISCNFLFSTNSELMVKVCHVNHQGKSPIYPLPNFGHQVHVSRFNLSRFVSLAVLLGALSCSWEKHLQITYIIYYRQFRVASNFSLWCHLMFKGL